jgi:Ca2+-binding RTX toxin-like protein
VALAGARRRSLALALAAGVLSAGLVVATAVADVSHKGWPHTRHFFSARKTGGVMHGTRGNDLMLGGPGSDTIYGGAGNDVIWGDQYPVPNNPGTQHDRLYGGAGNNWIYTSHGYNVVFTGPGNNHVFGYFGHGTIHCGAGHDVVTLSNRKAYRTPGCKVVLHGVP